MQTGGRLQYAVCREGEVATHALNLRPALTPAAHPAAEGQPLNFLQPQRSPHLQFPGKIQ
jgi:hypothetical protein